MLGIKISVIFTLLMMSTSSWSATDSKYNKYYSDYISKGGYWVEPTKVGTTSFSKGSVLAINDISTQTSSGFGGSAVVSESHGYAMILAALYNDQATFDKLSAFVQAGIPLGKSYGTATGLIPWSWRSTDGSEYQPSNAAGTNAFDSASDGDINIAIAYIYADKAASVAGYSWSAAPKQGGSLSYKTMASNYIKAIRLKDFAPATAKDGDVTKTSSVANQHILTLGADMAVTGVIQPWNWDWRPDYSDIRAYQLFTLYDSDGVQFWSDAITYTREAWKALFYFGSDDTGRKTWTDTDRPPTGVDIAASTHNQYILNHQFISNPEFNLVYKQVKLIRYQVNTDPDSSRMPVRVMNYVNASQNSGDTHLVGIANSLLTALGSTYASSQYASLSNTMNIWSPWAQNGSYVQDFIAADLAALAGNPSLKPWSTGPSSSTLMQYLNNGFGTNGTDGTFVCCNKEAGKNLSLPDIYRSFNSSLTLWALTVQPAGHTGLQTAMDATVVPNVTSGLTQFFMVNGSGTANTVVTNETSGSSHSHLVNQSAIVKTVDLDLNFENPSDKMVKISLTSPQGLTKTVANRRFGRNIVLRRKLVNGFKGQSIAGLWKLVVTGSSGTIVSTSLNVK